MSSAALEYTSANSDVESGYVSGSSSEDSLTEVYFTKPHLRYLNKQLKDLEPQEILKWAILSIPNLYQTTAFGLTGLVTIDMLSKLSSSSPIDLIFFDTTHHFNETLELVEKVQARYPNIKLHIYRPQGVNTEEEFASKYGPNLWETNDEKYDWHAKVEPAQRAYAELNVKAALTGRRKSQGGKRGDLDIIEIDDAGLIKINPLANWSFGKIQAYIKENNVPYNALLDMGYKSVGDWHSTQPVAEGEDERAGRWKGKAKTECGIHNSRSRYAQFLLEQEQLKQKEELAKIMEENADVGTTAVETTIIIPAIENTEAEITITETTLVEATPAEPTVVEEQQKEVQPAEEPVAEVQQVEIQPSDQPAVEEQSEAQPESQSAEANPASQQQSAEPAVEQNFTQIAEIKPLAIPVQAEVEPISS